MQLDQYSKGTSNTFAQLIASHRFGLCSPALLRPVQLTANTWDHKITVIYKSLP